MKSLCKTPPQCDARLARRALRKVVVALVSVALIGASVFAVSVAAPSPAEAQTITFRWHYITTDASGGHLNDFWIAAGASATFDLSRYITTSGTAACPDITLASTSKLSSISRNGCAYTVTAKATSTSGRESYTNLQICLTGTLQCTYSGRLVVNFRPAANLTFTAPTGLSVAGNRTLVINAALYASETHAHYTISCGDATNIDTREISTVTRNGCVFTVTPKVFTGPSGFTVPYSSTGGGTVNGRIAVQVRPATNIVYNPPSNWDIQTGKSINQSMDIHATDGTYTISCGTITAASNLITITQRGCDITITAGSTTGTVTISIPFTSSGGDTLTGTRTYTVITASNITFTAPSGLKVGTNRTRTIDASAYVTEANSDFTITCGDATNIDTTELMSVSRSGCVFTVTPKAVQGSASFTVPYTSSGGDTENGVINIEVGPESTVAYTAPGTLTVGRNLTLAIDALGYVTEDPAYTVTCGDATGVDANKLAVTRTANTCNFTIDPVDTLAPANQGDTTFTIPYTSDGGHSTTGTVTVNIGPDSNLSFTAPSTLTMGRNRTLVIDALEHVSENTGHTVTCADPTGVDATKMTVTRSTSGDGCSFTVDPVDTLTPANQGDTTFSVLFTTTGGTTATGTFTVNIGPDSNTVFTDPGTLTVGRNRTLVIDALDHVAEDAAFTVTCGDATGVDATKMTVTRSTSGDGCSFTVDPVDALTPANQGDTTFSVAFTSTGGTTATGTFTVNIGPDSNLTFTALPTQTVGRNYTLVIDALDQISGENAVYTVSCADATGVDAVRMTVTRSVSGDGCSFTVDPENALAPGNQGETTFSVLFTSTGGATATGTFTINIGTDSIIAYTAPTDLRIEAGSRTLEIDASSFAADNSYALTCSDASALTSNLATVTHTGSSCTFTATTSSGTASGSASFTITYSSAGGDARRVVVPVRVGPARNLVFTAPSALAIGAGGTLVFDVSSYATDGGFWGVTCGDSTANTARIASVARVGDTCEFRVTAGSSQGAASFTVPYTSETGAAVSGVVPVVVGAAANIVFAAPVAGFPSGLNVEATKSIVIDASGYASDGSFTISCGDAESVSGLWQSVVRDSSGSGCSFTATARAGASGMAGFTVPYASSRGGSLDGVISVLIRPLSDIVFTAPPTTGATSLRVVAGRVLVLDVSSYAADGDYAITCGAIAESSALISLGTQSGCVVPITAVSGAGTAAISVPYTSSGGDTLTGTVSLSVSRAVSGTAIPLLSNAGCTDGTFVNLTTNPRVTGANNDLAEDCMTLVAIQNHFAGFEANRDLAEFHAFREWGDASVEWGTGTASDRLVQNWIGITVTGGRVTDFVISATRSTVGGQFTIVHGTLPSEIQNLTALERLEADDHMLSGNIPSWLGSMSALNDVNLSDNNFSGPIPSELGNLSSLQFLSLHRNELSGSIPSQLGSLSNLRQLNLDSNQLTGSIPSQLGSLSSTAFTHLNLSGNRLSGSIPSQLTSLTAMRNLLLSNNLLTGSIPSGIGSLTSLVTLDLEGNRLSGSVPAGVSSLTNLFRLDLSNNQFTGAIPAAVGNLVTLNPAGNRFTGVRQVYICGNYFTGALPTGLQQTASSQYVLQDYPIAEGFNPVACQDAMAVPASGDIVFAPPLVVPVQAGGESVYVNAASYFTGSDYAATCADATGPAIDDSKLTITRSGCSYYVTAPAPSPVSRAFENVTFNVPYTQVSAGATQVNGVVTVRILPASSIAFNAPSNLFVSASSTVVVDASGAATDGPYAISCGDATGVDSTKFSSVVRSTSGNGCMFTIASTASTGDGTFTVPFSSSGGATGTGTFTVNVNNIVYTAPTDLSVAAGRSIEITASSYVTDGANTFTCADATNIDSAKITSVVRNNCVFTVTTAAAAAGENVAITVPVTSSGGATRSIVIPIAATPVSDIVFTAPAAVKIGAGNTKTIDVGAYAADGSYTVSCGFRQSTRHARLTSVAVNGCSFTLAAGSAQGAATLVVDYTSTGGDTQSGTVNLSIGPPSSVSFTAPAVPAVGRNRTLVINALDYVRENTAYAVSCSDAFDISTLPNIGFGLIRYRMSVARSTSGDGCAFTVDPLNTLPSNRWGNAIFRVVFTSEGGSSTTGTFTVNIRGDVAILFTDPGALAVPRNRILRIDATDHVEDGANTITCADATGFDSDKMAVTRRGCVYTVNPVNSLADSLLGETTFSAMFTSSGGSSTTGTFTIDIGPDTNIRTTNIPGTLFFTASVKVNLSRFATDGDYEIFCTSVSATAGTISNRAADSCVFDYSPSFLGRFNVSFRSAGGSTTTASINVAQSLGTYLRSFSFPAQSVAAGRTIEIEASRHISLSTPNTYFCFEPTNVDGKISVVLRGCRYIITAGSRQGAASFNVNFSITSGEVRSAAVAVNVGPASSIVFNAPAGLQVGRNRTLAIDATDYATDSSYTITCGDATGVDSTKLTSVSRNGCVFTVDPINSLVAGSQGDTSFTVPFTSSGGDTATGAFTVNIGPDSTITYTAPGALEIGRNFTFEIDASDYVSEISGSGYTIACSDAAGVAANRMAVTRTANTCEYTVAPVGNSEANAADRLAPALQGDTTFAITFTSTGGHIITRTLTINIGPDSVPMFTAPATNPAVGASLTRAVDVSSYATDGNYTISCGTISTTDADITLGTQTGCSVMITSVATTPQTADITIPYTSSGGGSTTGTLTLDVGVASNIVFTAPTGLKVGINRTQTIDASDYAADGGNTISCGTATNVDTTRLASVVRDTSGNGCGFTITPISTLTPAQQGTANFTVPYTSSGGDTQNGVIAIEVGPASNIVYTSPGTLSVARNLTLEIDASGYAADNAAYTISCGDATGVASARLAVTHTGSSCDFTIDPVDALAPGDQGTTTFTIPFTSDGGATGTGTVTVNIGPDSALTFTAPGTFTLGRNRTLVIDASAAISGENAAYTVSCADATGADATRMTVTRSTSGDGCSFTVDPVDTLAVGSQGDTTFSVAFSSTGGATATGTFTVNIGPDSTITANIPPATGAGRLQVARNLTLEIDASDYVAETSGSGYTISCSDARSIHSRLTSVARTASTCTYTIDPVNSATSGTATFVVTFTSTGGHSIVRTITVNVGPNSAITFTAPPTSGANRLLVGRNRTLAVDAGSYASETSGSGYTITCGDAVSIDTARLASVTHTGSSCSFTVTPVSSLSSSLQATNATFTVPYASSGGATADGIISVKVGPDSTITYNAPTLARGSNLRTFTIDASDYVSETSGSGYTISCGTATSVDTTEITSVTRLSNSCRYRIVLNGTQGSTGFTVPYTSTGGHAISRAVQITVGAASAIVFSAPASNPAVAASRTLTLDVGSYAADGSYTISCGTITESSALISLGNQTQGSCSIPIIAGTSTGTAAISVPYISSGGATLTPSITIDVGGASNISFTAPSDLKVGINRTQTINALDYASDSGYTITCGTATSVDSTRLTSVVRDASGNGCGYTITPISTLTQSQQGAASFTVPLTSDGGDTDNAVFSIAVGPASTITFTAPSALLVPKNRTLVVDVAPYAVEANPTNYAISCGDATSIDTVELQSVTRTANTCTFTITPKNVAGSASFTVPYTSEGGHSVDGVIPVTVGTDSTITYTSPGTLTVGRNRTLTIDASGYVEEIASSGHTITCSDAAGVDNTKLTSVTRTANTCSFTITPITTLTPALQGDTTFSITFTSSGGHSITRTITVNVGPDSTIVFTPPASNPAIAASRTRTIDVSSYAADGSYTISCGAITESSALISLGSQNGCSIPVTSGSSMGTATISIPYRSSGGHTLTSSLSIDVGAASSIVFNAPTGLKVGTNRTQRIDALDYASDGGYTITCGTATNTGANVPTSGTVALASVVRDASGNGCGYTITPTSTQGTATFTIPYTSAGGDTSSENISITVGPPSTIVYSSPGTLRVGRNQTLEIDASGYVSDNSAYTITCADATGVVATRMAVTRTANSCTFTIDPVDALTPANQGTTTFTIPFTSDGGHSITRTISVNIGPDSNLTFTAPSTFTLGRNRTLVINALAAISGENAAYTVSCADATGVDANKMTVTRSSSGNGCSFTVDPVDTLVVGSQGDATFSVPYTSTGGATASGTFTVNIGPDSTITANIPPATGANRLLVARNLTLEIDASDYVTEASNTYTISCSDARSIHSRLTSVARTANTCRYTIDPNNFAFPGAATFVVTFTSTGGHSIDRTITVNVGANSAITFTAPPTTGANRLLVGRNRALVVNAGSYARETSGSGYTITCGDATSIDTTRLASVTHTGSSCSFTVTPVSSLSSTLQATNATFTVPYSSTGGATANGTISVKVGPDSTITYNAPTLERGSNLRTFTIDAADYVSETSGSGYTISCGAPTSIDSTEITSVTRLSNSCRYRIVLNGTQGTTGFTVPYTSTGGHAISRAVQITVGAASSIVFSAPASNPAVAASRTRTIDVGSYATDGSYTISCGTISEFSALISLGAQTQGSCSIPITAGTGTGTAFISVPYISSGGARSTRSVSIDVGVASNISFTAPSDLKVGINRTQTINALDYASDSGYTITCGTATSIDTTRLTSVARDSSGNGCGYTITPISTLTQSQQGSASFTVPLTSDGGDTENAVFSIAVGPASTITFTAPSALLVPKNRTLVVDASPYAVEANPSNYAISCGDATSIDTVELQSVTRAGNTCTFTITPKNVAGSASFTVPYSSEGGHSVAGVIPVTVGTDSTITFTSPGTLTVGRNRTLTIDASGYVEEIASSGHTITCSDAAGVDSTKLTSVTRTANTCSFTITPITTLTPAQQGNATFRITFTSSGGHSITRTITVRVGPDSTIVFAAPASNPAIAASRTRTLDVSSYASDGSYTISCGAITESDPDITLGTQTGCSIPITAGSTPNQTADISIPYRSSGGHSITSTLTLDVGAASSIVFTAPTGLAVGINRTQRIDALDYASDGGYTITCGTATNTGANVPTTGTVALASVVRDTSGNGCGYTIRPTSAQGTATFTIPYTSAGGDTANGNISITVGAASNIRYSSPGTLRVGRNQTLEIDASGYASDGSYAISCADATGVDNTKLTSVSRTANTCTFTIDPVDALAPANQGTTTFSIAFTSAGGHSITRSIAVNIGPDSNLTFTAPSTFTLGRNRTLVIDALAAISGENAAYTVSCADATGVDANKMTVTRSSSGNRCSFTVDPVDTLVVGSQGDATFAVAFSSTGGATASGTFTVNIGPDSTITANIPPATGANRLQVARNLTLEIDASGYVSEASPTNYTISCSDARSIHSRLTSVARTANTCRYTIDPNNFAFPGAATFVVTFTSTGGHSIDRTITVNVGANSAITFTAPPTTGANRLLVGRNRALVVNAGSYARETFGSGYTISCGDATSIDSTRLASVTHSGSSCSFTVTPVSSLSSSLQATNATFTVPYSSSGGATATGTISVKVGPDSTITYNAPTLERGSNLRTFTIDAADYVSETSGSGYTISCGTATSVDTTEITSVTRLSNSCRYRIVLNGTQGTTSFTVPYTSTGGHAISRAVQITVGAASSIVFSAPASNPAVAASRTLTLDVSSYATDGSYTITCGTISEFSALISLGAQTGCSIPITAATSTGTAFISVPYISSGGATTTRSISIDVGVASDIQFTAPSNLKVGINRTQTINALDYATDSGYTITCGAATSVDSTKLTSVARDSSGNGCGYTITPISTLTQSQQGSASFTVPMTSDGGDTENAVFSIAVGPASTITFTAPVGANALSVAKNRTLVVDVAPYAVEANPTNYAISCGDATGIDTVELQSVTHTGSSCTFTINPKNVAGSASFTVPYTSEGGHSVNGAISVTVGPDSNIVYTPPTGLRVGRNRTLVIDATDHFTEDNTYTVTCGDATGIDSTRLTSVARTANTCTFTVDPIDTLAVGLQGNTSFTVPLSSTGGHTRNAQFTVNVGPDSNIVFAAPTGLKVGRNRTLAINALAAVTENGVYTVTCADATGVSANRMTVTRTSTGTGCVFTVDPVDTLATGLQGNTTFAVAFTSTGGATASGTFTVNIGPDSTITYNAPTGLLVGRNRTLTIDASGYVSESDSNNTITCGDATAIHSRLTSVARTANTCSYTIDPNNFATPGTATFSIAFTSDGGHTRTETISVEIGPNSTIRFTTPPTFGPNRLRIGRNLTLAIDALDYAAENMAYTVTCGDATGVDAARLTVTHTGSSCDFTIDPVDTLAQSLQGNTSFTIPYTSNGGATATGRITVNIGPDSSITFTPPTGLKIGRNRTLAIDALAAISGENAAYTVSCADATGVDANRMTVTRSSSGNRCSFTVDPVNSLTPANQGDTTFAVAFSSTGGATASGTFTVNIGPDSTIAYTAPAGLLVGRNRTLTVDVSSAAADGSYTVSCGDAANVHPRFSSVTRPDAQASPCVFAATPRTTASLGTASFVVPFTSDGGATSTGTVSIAISQPSTIVFTAPDPALKIGINRARVIDALDYARDGNYTITCLDATGVDSTKLTSVTRSSSGNGCGYTINPISSLTQSQQGDATFTVPYRSAGGHVLNQVFTIGVGPASTIVYTAPVGANALTVGHNRTLTIDASSYAADGSYAISCGDARSIHARIDHITRQGCSFTITPVSGMTGAATFTVPYSSAGGHTTDGQVSVAIGAASNIVYSAPSGIVIPASTARTIDVGSYASDGSYAISCGDATGVNASRLASVTHTGSSCSFEITAAASQGATSFVVPYRSAGGAALSGTISLSVGPASSITFTAPAGLDVHVGETLLVHANDYASDGPYSLQCADATNRSASLTSVVRTANTCDFTITPGSSTGTGSFNVAYTSSGGATATGTISVNISPQSTIAFTAPTGLSVAAGRSVTVDASTAADTGYTVSCGDATAVNPRIASVSRTGCSYAVRAGSIAGSASFTIPFTSTGGATLNAQIAITIGPRSSIAFAAPTGLSVQIGSTLTIDASDYASDSAYTITCGDATGVPSVFASVARTANTCSFVITPGASTGTGSFTVPYSSSGGATRNGSITVAVTPTSSIVFAPPPISGPNRLRIGAGNTRTINLASYATDGPYSITCGNATAAEPAKLTDIHRNACRYTITAAAAAAQGNTTFSLTYTSSGGNTNNASFTINIGPASNIVYTAPTDITLQANSARGIDLSSYAADGTGNDAYTIACLDATDIDPEISSVTRNGCVYTIRAGSTPGEADFHITYTSTGGDTHLATVHITITPAPVEPEERPAGPIQPIDPPARRPTPPPPTTTTTTTTPDPSRPTTTLEPDQPGPRWNTLTAQQGGTTPGQIRQAFNLGSTQTIYTWNTQTQTWTRATRGAQTIPAGTRVSFRTEEAVTNREMRTSNLGGDTTRMRLTAGWSTLSIPQGITRTDDTDFLLDPTLTDCRNQQGIIAIAAYSTRSRRWSISLPCHPTAQRRLTTGENAPYRPLASIAPADTTYIYTRTRQPLTIRWNSDTQTYQVFQSIFG